MKREHALRRQLESLQTLGQAIDAMKSLSAHHLRAARASLESARTYREGVSLALASIGIAQEPPRVRTQGMLLVAADLGLCDGYNTRLVEAALAEARQAPGPLYCLGQRPLTALRRAGARVERSYAAAPSVDGVTRVLLTLADDVLSEYLRGQFSTLVVVSARFDGVGVFTPVVTHVLPVVPPQTSQPPTATPYVTPSMLARTAVREFLYCTLYELLLDALASEHGARLVATQSAGEWLDERTRALKRKLAAVRQESNTQEVLDVASGARMRRRSELASRAGLKPARYG